MVVSDVSRSSSQRTEERERASKESAFRMKINWKKRTTCLSISHAQHCENNDDEATLKEEVFFETLEDGKTPLSSPKFLYLFVFFCSEERDDDEEEESIKSSSSSCHNDREQQNDRF